ncbi:hypothetical protein NBRC111894_2370 [Sporolactobacillus inulinus]|uniref:Uncharacterized protein n=2 Tax=Sporolactobacillus TaxID=2077 RepID=A0A917S640_9BACL|nr:hypothetical protein NBRC111894_2370 [Sporolactobacillus inulinus]GEB76762.1 hypothetical protein SIN01_11070 [Sporolactobacillus inulinus]GGL59748.1 hypothetical protein GCM10007968_24670 [Sporolactobacillus putidus]
MFNPHHPANWIPSKVVFAQNRYQQDRWIVIFSTDCTMTEYKLSESKEETGH